MGTKKSVHVLTKKERYEAWVEKQKSQTAEEKEAERRNSFYRLQPMSTPYGTAR